MRFVIGCRAILDFSGSQVRDEFEFAEDFVALRNPILQLEHPIEGIAHDARLHVHYIVACC